MKKKFFVVAVVFFSSYTQGQDTAAITLDEVIVTANKTEQKQSTTGKVITIIDQACLKRNAGRTISEILNYQSGIFINGANNTLGSNQDFYFRGSSTGNVLVLIDGIPVGDPSQINNGFDLNSLSIPSIERIEILKGAQSTLWGSDAVSGVINIITKKKGTKKISPSVILSFGSYHTGRAAAGINGTISNFSYNVSHSYTRSRGFSSAYDSTGSKQFDKDGFRQHNFQARLGYRWSPDLSISSLLSSGTYTADIDAGAFTDDRDFIATNKNNLYSIDAAFTRSKRTLHFINSWSQAKRTFKDDSGHVGGFANYAAAKYTGSSFISELFADIHLSGNVSLLAGIQSHWQKTDQYYKSSSSFGLYETAIGDSAKTNNISFYTSFLVTWVGKLNTELGFRYNLHNIYGNNSSFSFNPSYTIDDHKKIFINISSGFKTPSLYQLYSEYGNKLLNPEESINYEVGIQLVGNNKRNRLRIVAFKRDIKNVIIFYTNPTTYVSRYINNDIQNDFGFELESNFTLGKKASVSTSITYVNGKGKNDNEKIKNLYRRPNFSFNSQITIETLKGLTIIPSCRFAGSRLKGIYDIGPAQMPHYYTIDIYSSYNLNNKITVFMDLRNITNQVYFDIPGYNSRAFNMTMGLTMAF